MRAECQCDHLSVELPVPRPPLSLAMHRLPAAQRIAVRRARLLPGRSQLIIAGEVQRFERLTNEGNTFETFFCPTCGSTVYSRASKHPPIIGVAVGSIADPDFQPPVRSVWEQMMPSSRTPP
jgi:glutathione-dependent formaldehyde-activating enzyme